MLIWTQIGQNQNYTLQSVFFYNWFIQISNQSVIKCFRSLLICNWSLMIYAWSVLICDRSGLIYVGSEFYQYICTQIQKEYDVFAIQFQHTAWNLIIINLHLFVLKSELIIIVMNDQYSHRTALYESATDLWLSVINLAGSAIDQKWSKCDLQWSIIDSS
jgi:hypothetical protein